MKKEAGMYTPEVKVEQLQWQLDLLVGLEPEAVGRAVGQFDYGLSENLEDWAGEILSIFTERYFEGFGAFLIDVERRYRMVHQKVGAVEDEVFKAWEKIYKADDDTILASALYNGAFSFVSENDSAHGESYERHMGLFDVTELCKFSGMGTLSQESQARLDKVIRALSRSGPYRRFNFEPDAIANLERLEETSPHFNEVTERIMDAVALANAYSKPIRITPILLVGNPGIGKSFYAGQLARCLGVPIKRIAIDNLQEGAGLAGSSFIYSNSEPGEVFRVLAEGDHLSPVVILDEIDKAGTSVHGDPLSALHGLLEPVSARHFKDGSIDLAIDASRVIWIATANYISRIPRSLASRFEIFEIDDQDPRAKTEVLQRLCRELQYEYPGMEFSDKVLEALRDNTPREQRQLLERALSRAKRCGETIVDLGHLEQILTKAKLKPRKSIGYL